jgi:hypothetical protein
MLSNIKHILYPRFGLHLERHFEFGNLWLEFFLSNTLSELLIHIYYSS